MKPLASLPLAVAGALSTVGGMPPPKRRALGWIGIQPPGLGRFYGPAMTLAERARATVERHARLDARHGLPARTDDELKAAGLPHQGKREMERRVRQMARALA